jgi:GntR family transcriptional regulator
LVEHVEQSRLEELERCYILRMTKVDPIGNPDYAYLQAADAITARIEAGEITYRLPAERDLARELGVAYQTLRHSMKVLRARGLIITRQGRGTFVAPFARRDEGSDDR